MKQSSIVDSTMEVEYIAASEAAKEAVWLKIFLMDLDVVPSAHKSLLIREIVNRGNAKVSRLHQRTT